MKELLQKHRRNWKEHTGMMSSGKTKKKKKILQYEPKQRSLRRPLRQ
jgi:hypothetical protein